ncbi:MAG TPA: hypothetical protein ENF43_00775 [Thermoplasmatales archaeon]|nr:hypothetical protein [Thermoplasmatales archaeon]
MKKIVLVGIKHTEMLADQLKRVIHTEKPDVICVEADNFTYRLATGKAGKEEIERYFSNLPKIYKIISLFKIKAQKKSKVNRDWHIRVIKEVSDKLGLDVIPIDMDQLAIYQKIEDEMKLAEKLRLFFDAVINRSKKRGTELREEFSKRYPTLKRYLIDERDTFMANRIIDVMRQYDRVVAVVGNAHIERIEKRIKANLTEEDLLVVIDADSLRSR